MAEFDETVWHKCTVFFPRRTIDRRWAFGTGQIWRRRNLAGKWEYQQDEYDYESWADKQW